MTGFGRGAFTLDGRGHRIEIRSYNNRFLDVKLRLPWPSALIESRAVAAVKRRVARGRVEVAIHTSEATGEGPGELRLNRALARDLAGVLADLAAELGCDASTAAQLVPPVRDLVISGAQTSDDEQAWRVVAPHLDEALDQLLEMRAAEGAALARDLVAHLSTVEELGAKIQVLARDQPRLLQEKLDERLRALRLDEASIDPIRVAQEVAHLVDRRDVSEELARIGSHAQQMRQTMEQVGPVGRRIEFLLQELNRELTTISAKADGAEIAHLAVEAKGELEKMREQALNVE